MVQMHGWLSSGRNVTTNFFQVVAWYESFGKGSLRLPNPPIAFFTFTTEALAYHWTRPLCFGRFGESWGWPVVSDCLLIGQRFRPTHQSGAKTCIRGQFTYLNMQPSNRPIKARNAATCTVWMHLRLPIMWK